MNIRQRELGFLALVSIVIGSQLGSGMFVLPSEMAPFKLLGFFGWIVSVTGAISLALVFSDLSHELPKSGGPHVYVKEAFGHTAGFFTGWTYWLISWSSNSVLLVTIVNYLSVMTGKLSVSAILGIESLILIVVTCVNFTGIRFSGKVETVLIFLKVVPLLVLPLIFFAYFDPSNLELSSLSESENVVSNISTTALLTFWGFIGVECATTPAGSVKNPKTTIPKALIVGTSCVALIYILNAVSIAGVVGFDNLANVSAPYSIAVKNIFGSYSNIFVSILAITVCIGTLNSWTLTGGQIAYGASLDGLFPKMFGRVNRFGAPVITLAISCIGSLPFLVLEQLEHGGLDKLINILVSVFLYVYIICCVAYLRLLNRWNRTAREKLKGRILAGFAIAFCIFVLLPSITESILALLVFIIVGFPVFLKIKRADT
ncbi:MAG: amino acid permease [Holosporales bacterium]|nr:amino acid permease [Holosporales bacterium]